MGNTKHYLEHCTIFQGGLFRVPFPQTKAVNFEEVFEIDPASEQRNYLVQLTAHREDLRNALQSGHFKAVIESATTYANSLAGMLDVLRNTSVPIKNPITKEIAWTSAFPLPSTRNMRFHDDFLDLRYDLVMTLSALACGMMNDVTDINDGTFSDINEMTKQLKSTLCKAAGTFLCAGEGAAQIAQRPKQRPIEVNPAWHRILSNICLIQAHSIILSTAMKTDKTKHVLSVLSKGMATKITETLGDFDSLGVDRDLVPPAFLKFLTVGKVYYEAMHRFWMGEHEWEKEEHYGVGLGHVRVAMRHFNAISDSVIQMQKDPLTGSFGEKIQVQGRRVAEHLKKYEDENKSIYFELVKEEGELPEGKFFPQTVAYVLQPDAAECFNSMMPMGRATSSGGTPSADSTQAK